MPKKDNKQANPMMPPEFQAPERYKVYNSKGDLTNIEAEVSFIFWENDYDVATLKGDFVSFNKIALQSNVFKLKAKDKLYSCGYAGSFVPPICNDGEYVDTFYFKGIMTNYVARGMSGGPVFNKDFKAVGVNSSKLEKQSMFGPLFGLIKEQ